MSHDIFATCEAIRLCDRMVTESTNKQRGRTWSYIYERSLREGFQKRRHFAKVHIESTESLDTLCDRSFVVKFCVGKDSCCMIHYRLELGV